MGKQILGSLIIMVIFLSLQTLASSKHHSKGKTLWHGHELPPEPHKGYYEHLMNCIKVLSDKCGTQMLDYIVDKRIELSYVCCHQLVKMGKECYEQLSDTISNMKDFEKWKPQIHRKTKDAYHQCAHVDRCVANNW